MCDEIDLSLGYYNLANAIAPDGQRRSLFGADNVWWSPDARVFFDITANLDALFDDAVHHRYSLQQAAAREDGASNTSKAVAIQRRTVRGAPLPVLEIERSIGDSLELGGTWSVVLYFPICRSRLPRPRSPL